MITLIRDFVRPNGRALSLPQNVSVWGCGTDNFQNTQNETSSC